MEKTLSTQAKDWREGRRFRALELKEQGWKQTHIAEALGVSEGAVSQWMKRAREKGVQALREFVSDKQIKIVGYTQSEVSDVSKTSLLSQLYVNIRRSLNKSTRS